MLRRFNKLLGITMLGLTGALGATSATANELPNPGFEDGTTEWFSFGTLGGLVLTSDTQEGQRAVYVDIAGGGGGQVYQKYTGPEFVVGKKLHFSAYVKTVPGTGGTPQVYLVSASKISGVFYDSTVHDLRSGAVAATLPNWTKLNAVFTVQTGRTDVATPVPAGDFLALRVLHDTPGITGNSRLYVDNASLLEMDSTDDGNLLENGSFELGSLAWTPWYIGTSNFTATPIDDVTAHDGASIMHTTWTAAAEARQLHQDIVDPSQTKLVPGRQLLFSAWYRAQYGNAANTPALVNVFGDESLSLDPNTFKSFVGQPGSQSSWKRISSLISVPASGNYKSLRVTLSSEAAGSAGSADWDDVRLADFSTTGSELITNGSFEADLLGWATYFVPASTTSVDVVSDAANAVDGDNFARITYGTQINALQLISDLGNISTAGLTDGQELTFSAWYRAPSLPAGGTIKLTKGFMNTGGNFIEYDSSDALVGPKSQWTKISYSFPYVVDSEFNSLRLILNADAATILGTAGTLEWDDVRLTPYTPPNAAGHWELY